MPDRFIARRRTRDGHSGPSGWDLGMGLTPSPRTHSTVSKPRQPGGHSPKMDRSAIMWTKQISCQGRMFQITVLSDVTRDPIRPYFPGKVPCFVGFKELCPGFFFPSHKNSIFLTKNTKILTFPAVGIALGRGLVCGRLAV